MALDTPGSPALDPASTSVPVNPAQYVLVPIIPIIINYQTASGQYVTASIPIAPLPNSSTNGYSMTVGLPATATVGQLLSLPSVVSKITYGSGTNMMLVATDPASVAANTPARIFSNAMTIENLSTLLVQGLNTVSDVTYAWNTIGIYTYWAKSLNFSVTPPSGSALTIPMAYSQLIGAATLGDVYPNLLSLAMSQAGVSNSASQRYGLLNTSLIEFDLVPSITNYVVGQVIGATDDPIQTLQPLTPVAISSNGNPVGISVWAPGNLQVQDVAHGRSTMVARVH